METNTSVLGQPETLQTRDPHELLTIFNDAQDLPTLPEVALRLQKTINDPKSNARDVARIIEDDPAIAAKVLKVVNSVFYASSSRMQITQLQPAIARLGFLTIANIALSTSVFGAFARAKWPIFDRREFWKHSICVGIVASVLHDYCSEIIYSGAKAAENIRNDSVHLAGIVHDLGKILFEKYANPEFHVALKNAALEDIPAVKEEARFIGMGHDEAGAWLGVRWALGADILAVLRWHHDPLACPDAKYLWLVKLIHMADYICHNQKLGSSGNPSPSYDNRIREEFQLTTARIAEVIDQANAEAAKSEILLSLAE